MAGMTAEIVRQYVKNWRQSHASDWDDCDCFPAWFLSHKYNLSPIISREQSADPAHEGKVKGFDFGLDAFHFDLDTNPGHPELLLVQSKFSSDVTYIGQGLRDLERCLKRVHSALLDAGTEQIENKIVTNLRTQYRLLKDRNGEQPSASSIRFRLVVLHLCEQERHQLNASFMKRLDDLRDEVEAVWPGSSFEIELIGPADIDGAVLKRQAPAFTALTLNAVHHEAEHGEKALQMHSGIGYLAELVTMYQHRREDLFSKNVRYFLKSKKNTEKGPSGRIRSTLRRMCLNVKDDSIDPRVFAFFHNGITIFAKQVQVGEGEEAGRLKLVDPYVLNGCQTIKTAFLFRGDARLKDKIDLERWNRICVPVRVITTRDEEIVRQVTINNNRQNQIPPAALHANDQVQIDLADRFGKHKIFYQRQAFALDEIREASPERLKEQFPSSNSRCVDIEELARTLAAVAGDFDGAYNPSHIFEEDKAYEECFGAMRLSSIVFLTFLANVHAAIGVVLKRDLSLKVPESPRVRPTRLMYYAICLLIRHLAKTRNTQMVLDYGLELWGKHDNLREDICKQLDNYRSGIKRVLESEFLSLDESRSEKLNNAFRRAESKLSLRNNIDPFKIFGDLDSVQ